jgi:hypothetical protein
MNRRAFLLGASALVAAKAAPPAAAAPVSTSFTQYWGDTPARGMGAAIAKFIAEADSIGLEGPRVLAGAHGHRWLLDNGFGEVAQLMEPWPVDSMLLTGTMVWGASDSEGADPVPYHGQSYRLEDFT